MTPRRVLVAVPDLFFSTRIAAAAKLVSVEVEMCQPEDLAKCALELKPNLVIVDLHAPGVLEGIRTLRAHHELADKRIVGFYSHVDRATRAAAIEAGVHDPMPRSVFTDKLQAILSGEHD